MGDGGEHYLLIFGHTLIASSRVTLMQTSSKTKGSAITTPKVYAQGVK